MFGIFIPAGKHKDRSMSDGHYPNVAAELHWHLLCQHRSTSGCIVLSWHRTA